MNVNEYVVDSSGRVVFLKVTKYNNMVEVMDFVNNKYSAKALMRLDELDGYKSIDDIVLDNDQKMKLVRLEVALAKETDPKYKTKYGAYYEAYQGKAVTVIDAPCGFGKSEWAIQYMKKNRKSKKFIYITPYLSEIERIEERLPYFSSPESSSKKNKSDDLYKLIRNGENIVSTHEMFKNLSEDMREYISTHEYELLLDEVVEVANNTGMGIDAIPILEDKELIRVDPETNRIQWIGDKDVEVSIGKKYSEFQKTIKNQDVYLVKDSQLVWIMDSHNFLCFDKVYVLTYMFSSQHLKYYFDWLGIKYRYKSVRPTFNTRDNKFPDVEYELFQRQIKMDSDELKKLINVHEGKNNRIGQGRDKVPKAKLLKDFSLSSTKLKNMNKNSSEAMRKALANYFKNISKAKADERLWTIIKGDDEKILKKVCGPYKNQYLAVTARGTNNYSNRTKLAYLCNRFMFPMDSRFFGEICGVRIEEDGWALSELIQWLYRSAIRNGEPIELYIPSIRMRTLLYVWIENGGIWKEIPDEMFIDDDDEVDSMKELFS